MKVLSECLPAWCKQLCLPISVKYLMSLIHLSLLVQILGASNNVVFNYGGFPLYSILG